MHTGELGGEHYLVIALPCPGARDVVAHGPGEELRVLRQVADPRA